MRAVFLAVAGNTVEKFFACFRRLHADSEDLHFSFEVSFSLVDNGGKFNRRTIDVLQRRLRESVADG
jgi:hypothetical protein